MDRRQIMPETNLQAEICEKCGSVTLAGSGVQVGYTEPEALDLLHEVTFADLLVDNPAPHTGPCYTVDGWLVSKRRATLRIKRKK